MNSRLHCKSGKLSVTGDLQQYNFFKTRPCMSSDMIKQNRENVIQYVLQTIKQPTNGRQRSCLEQRETVLDSFQHDNNQLPGISAYFSEQGETQSKLHFRAYTADIVQSIKHPSNNSQFVGHAFNSEKFLQKVCSKYLMTSV